MKYLQEQIEKKDFLELLDEYSQICCCIYRRYNLFNITATEFLNFAKKDMSEGNKRGLVNAITNAKRAIANRIDHLLLNNKINSIKNKSGGIPSKLELLDKFGIKMKNVVHRKINKIRNELEHKYRVQKLIIEEVEDIIDIAELYLENTQKYIEKGTYIMLELYEGNNIKEFEPIELVFFNDEIDTIFVQNRDYTHSYIEYSIFKQDDWVMIKNIIKKMNKSITIKEMDWGDVDDLIAPVGYLPNSPNAFEWKKFQ